MVKLSHFTIFPIDFHSSVPKCSKWSKLKFSILGNWISCSHNHFNRFGKLSYTCHIFCCRYVKQFKCVCAADDISAEVSIQTKSLFKSFSTKIPKRRKLWWMGGGRGERERERERDGIGGIEHIRWFSNSFIKWKMSIRECWLMVLNHTNNVNNLTDNNWNFWSIFLNRWLAVLLSSDYYWMSLFTDGNGLNYFSFMNRRRY